MIVEFYIDAAGEYRWRLKAKNGRIMADSGEGYKTSKSAQKAFHKMTKHLFGSDHVRVMPKFLYEESNAKQDHLRIVP